MVKDLALPQLWLWSRLQLRSDPWPGSSICHGVDNKKGKSILAHALLCPNPSTSFCHIEIEVQTSSPGCKSISGGFMGSGLLFHSPLAHPTLPTLVFLFLRSPGVVPSSGPAYWPFPLRGCSSPASSWGFPLPIRWSQARFYFLQEAFPDMDCKVSSPSPSVLLLLYCLHRMHHNLKHVYLACLFVCLFVYLFIYLFIYLLSF